jgi:hypothetical protein
MSENNIGNAVRKEEVMKEMPKKYVAVKDPPVGLLVEAMVEEPVECVD